MSQKLLKFLLVKMCIGIGSEEFVSQKFDKCCNLGIVFIKGFDKWIYSNSILRKTKKKLLLY